MPDALIFARSAFGGLALLLGVAAAAAADGPKPYAPVAVTIGRAIEPPPDLVETARRLHDAAARRDVAAVAAFVAADLTVVTAAVDLALPRQATRLPSGADAAAILRLVGTYAGGDWAVPKDASAATKDAIVFERAFKFLVAATERAEWGRDPLVAGGSCSYRGRTWAAGAMKSQADGWINVLTGGMVRQPIAALAEPKADAAAAGRLRPGRIYLDAVGLAMPEGWGALRLPAGKVGWVPTAMMIAPQPTGICFLPAEGGGWLLSAIASVGS